MNYVSDRREMILFNGNSWFILVPWGVADLVKAGRAIKDRWNNNFRAELQSVIFRGAGRMR